MAAIGDDCYFFCTSSCAKGAACPFRHVEAAKTCKIICQHWQTTGCFRPLCKFRHSDFHIQINYSEIPCYWETQPAGCNKSNCAYKHSKPRPHFKTALPKVDPISSPKQDGVNEERKESVETFVMPTVKPIIIDPESEASNSSPVKKPLSSVIKEDDTSDPAEEADLSQKIKEKSEDVKATVKEKGVDEPVKKKKKKPVLKQNNGKAVGVKKKAATTTAKAPPKKKKVVNEKKGKPTEPVKKKVKERLGVKPVVSPIRKEEESDDDDSADSDDSIENIKVLSMEEIFRQKALESMMKKRAEEGKPLLPYSTSKPRQAVASHPVKPVVESQRAKPAVVPKRAKLAAAPQRARPTVASQRPKPSARIDRPKKPVIKKPPTPPPESDTTDEEEEDSEEEEDEGDDEDEHVESKDKEDEEEDAKSSSSSPASSADSSESEEETEVRRVVINLDAEKTARDRAKASLLKKRVGDGSVSATTKLKRRKVIKDDTRMSSFSKNSSPRPSIKDRLGVSKISQPRHTNVMRKIDQRLGAPKEDMSSPSEENESNENSDDDLSNIKIKSLEGIRQEPSKRLGSSPVKERLGPPKESEDEEIGGRQILIEDDLPAKKVKKRPWTSGHSKVIVVGREEETELSPRKKVKKTLWSSDAQMNNDGLETGGEDERTVSATSLVESDKRTNTQLDEAESAFESLRQRAFLKKTLQIPEVEEPELDQNEGVESDEKEERASSRKRKKHKHKHKRHKKSKSERQIYVPPAKKSFVTVVTKDDLPEQDKKVRSPTRALTVDSRLNDIPDYVDEDAKPSAPLTARQRRKHKAGALWAAGLSVSAKGVAGRRPITMGISTEIDVSVPHSVSKAQSILAKIANSVLSTSTKDNPVPVVKTFSQIMAEKRQKRLQPQDKKGSDETSDPASNIHPEGHRNLSSPLRITSKPEESRSRVPITPITFDRKTSKREHPPRVKPIASIASFNRVSTSVPITSSSNTSTAARKSTMEETVISSSLPIKTTTTSSAFSMGDIQPSYKTARAKKLFKKTKPLSQDVDPLPGTDSSIHIPQVSNKQHKSLESLPILLPSGDVDLGNNSIKSPPDGKKQRRASTAVESRSKQRSSLDDEFNFFDGGDIDISDIEDMKDMEPIDDLLQDIDKLLA